MEIFWLIVPLMLGSGALMFWLLARQSGWRLLLPQYRRSGPIQGEQFGLLAGHMGRRGHWPVQYRGVLLCTVNQEGFSLSLIPPFNFMQPPLFIPWSAVHSIKPYKQLWLEFQQINLTQPQVYIRLRGNVTQALLQHYARACATPGAAS